MSINLLKDLTVKLDLFKKKRKKSSFHSLIDTNIGKLFSSSSLLSVHGPERGDMVSPPLGSIAQRPWLDT